MNEMELNLVSFTDLGILFVKNRFRSGERYIGEKGCSVFGELFGFCRDC